MKGIALSALILVTMVAGILAAPQASADNEGAVVTYGSAICQVENKYFTGIPANDLGVVTGMMSSLSNTGGYSNYDAAGIVIDSTQMYCNQNMPYVLNAASYAEKLYGKKGFVV